MAFKHFLLAAILLVIVFGAGAFFFPKSPFRLPLSSSQTKTKYHIVSLNNGQVYFGTLRDVPGPFLGLVDSYIVVASESGPAKLVARRTQIYGPADTMWINRRMVRLIETVGDDSDIGKALSSQKETISFSSKEQVTQKELESVKSEPAVAGVATTQPSQKLIVNNTELGFLRVRDNPNTTSSSEIARVATGSAFPVVGQEPGWYQIEYLKGKTGWVSSSYVTVSP